MTPEAQAARLREVRSFLSAQRTWFDVEEDERYAFDDLADSDTPSILLSSREHSADTERASRVDVEEGQRLARLLTENFPDLNVTLDVVDEWVSISVDALPKRYSVRELAEVFCAATGIAEDAVTRVGGTFQIAHAGTLALVSAYDGLFLYPDAPSSFSLSGEKIAVRDLDEARALCAQYRSKAFTQPRTGFHR